MARFENKLMLFFAAAAVVTAMSASFLADELKLFSHKEHIENGAECTGCHNAKPKAGELPTLNEAACADCHDDVPGPRKLPAKKRSLELEFKHKLHVDAAECTDCHQATADGTQRSDRPVITQKDCQTCHAENGVAVPARQCSKCHGVKKSKVKPKTHKTSWPLRHGKQSEWRHFAAHGEDCYLCHKKRECVTCHQTSRPRDHNGLWRMRMHGVAAEWDRDRCKTCHETGTCIACHRRTKPLYHRGAWKAVHGLAAQLKDKDRCMTCHNPGWCSRCHMGGQ